VAKWPGANWPQDAIPPSGQFNGIAASIPFWDDQLSGDAAFALDPSNFNRSPWDTVSIAGIPLPGLCRVEPGTRRKKRLDKKAAKGRDGATITFQGYECSEIIVKCRIWTQEQLQALGQMMPVLIPPAPGTQIPVTVTETKVTESGGFKVTSTKTSTQNATVQSQAVTGVQIYHPSLALLGINSVVIESVSPLFPTSVKGQWEMDIRCAQFIPSAKGNNTSTATGTQNYGNNIQTAIQANPESIRPKLPSSDPGFTGPNAAQ
jgi:hypothetical protein